MTDWFSKLRSIVGRHEPADDPHALPRAAAALMLEIAITEDGCDETELRIVHEAMQRAFAIDPAELDALVREAHGTRDRAVSLQEFTRELRTGLQPAQRAELVGWMWRVAFADSRLGMHEEHLVRRVADLLCVPHHEFIRRKLLAQEAAAATHRAGSA